MKNIVILSTQRSGSTMVCDDFEGTGVLGRPSEYFIKAISSFNKNEKLLARNLLDEVYSKGLGKNGLSSVKVMSNQLEAIKKIILTADFDKEDRPDFAFKEYFKEYAFIRVKRLDNISQAVSRISAEKTGVYHSTKNNVDLEGMVAKTSEVERDEKLLNISFDEIETEVRHIEKEETYLDRFIEKLNINVLTLIYENCIDERQYLFTVGEFCNSKVSQISDRRLSKVSKGRTQEIITAYKEKKK